MSLVCLCAVRLSCLLIFLAMKVTSEMTMSDGCPTDLCFCFAGSIIECRELLLRRIPRFSENITKMNFSEIDLSENRIRYFGPESFQKIRVHSVKMWRNSRKVNVTMHPRSLDGLQPVLRMVSFRKNSIPTLPKGLFRGFHQLKVVDFTDNRLEVIQRGIFGYGREAVERLSLDKNHIHSLDEKVFSSLVQLKELTISKNFISFIDSRAFLGLESLEYLNLRYNRIRDLQPNVFSHLGSLKHLDLGNNAIPAVFPVMFQGTTKLEVLILSNNPIITIARESFSHMTSLTELRLDRSKLTHLKPGIFDGLTNLRTLFLQESGIRTLSNGLFAGMKALTKIRLESNELRTINACSFEFGPRKRTDVWIKNNLIHCDCSLAWTALYASSVRLYGSCKTPQSMDGQHIAYHGKYHVCIRHSGLEDCPQNIMSDISGSKTNWIRIH